MHAKKLGIHFLFDTCITQVLDVLLLNAAQKVKLFPCDLSSRETHILTHWVLGWADLISPAA